MHFKIALTALRNLRLYLRKVSEQIIIKKRMTFSFEMKSSSAY